MTSGDPGRGLTRQPASRIIVRPAEPADYPWIAQLTVAAYRDDQQVWPGHPYELTLTDVAGRASAGELLVAQDGSSGQLLGSVLLVRASSRYAELCVGTEAEFRMLAVDPAAQGRGVGRALVQACLDRASALGCDAMVISTRDFSVNAHRLYERFGFERIPERDWVPAPGVNLLALRRELPVRPVPASGSPDDNGGTTVRREG